MKSVILNLRIPAVLKEKLESDATDNNITLSDYTREIISNHYENSIEEEFPISFFNTNDQFYNSSDFIFLITWMLEKRMNPYDQNQKFMFYELKRILLKIIKNDYFTYDLIQEFEKIFVDVSRFINEYDMPKNHFRFCLANYTESFNYGLLINLVYNKAFENKIYM